LDALDRLARGPVDPAQFVATIREALERLREERDELQQINRDWFGLQDRERRLTEGLRGVANAYGCFAGCTGGLPGAPADGSGHTPACAAARALLSANPPQGDAADFCEHGYTTEDSAHPSAGLERCPTCSPSDGGGAK
jgi:hypothetical protein